MVFYRFNSLSQSLKNSSGNVLTIYASSGRSGAPRFVYKPILSKDFAPSTVSAASSSHGHGVDVPKRWAGWENWKSWRDVPDHLIPKSSKRDPDNLVYEHPEYIKLRKQQIWCQIPNGVPIYLRMGARDYIMYYGLIVSLAIMLSYNAYGFYEEIYKKYYPD